MNHGLTRDLGPVTTGLLVLRLGRALKQPQLMDAHRTLCKAWNEELLGEEELEDEGLTSRFLVRFLDGPLAAKSVNAALGSLNDEVTVEEAWFLCLDTGVNLLEDADEPGWRCGPPPGLTEVGELPFSVEGYPAILEDFDWEDFGVTVTLAGEPVPGEQDVVAAFHTFWLGTYVDERVLDRLDDSLDEEELEELEEELDPTCFRQGGVAWDGRKATLWVDRFNHPGTVEEVVHHLLWLVNELARVVPIAGATFGGADMSQKYGESLGGAEAHVCLGHNPLSERIAEEGLEAALYWLEKHPSHSGDTKAAMLVDAAHHLDHDDDSDVPERLLRAAVALQPASADAQLALIELYSELERTDDALAVAIEHDRFVRVWIKRVGLLGEAERLDELRAALAESRSEALLGTDLYNLGFLLHEAGRKEAALLVYEAALAFPDVPSFAFNNVIIVASELELHERASALADRAQAVAEDNNYIYHSAACAYVAVGELDKALDQVKRAVASGYEHLDRLRVDEELGPLLRLPEFQALFADVP